MAFSQINSNEKKYILPLDNLDRNLLSRIIDKPPNEKRPLWSKPSKDGESTYYEVKIVDEEIEDESYVEISETTMCHICNINVPICYYKEHIESRQHYNYKKITDQIMKNAKKIKKQKKIVSEKQINSEQYYCETCSKAVSVKLKQTHNKTKLHLESIEKQKLIYDFIDMYLNKVENEPVNNDKIGSNSNNVEKSGNDKESLFNTDSVKEQTSGSDNGNNEVLKYQESDSSSSDKIGSNSNNVEKSGNDKESLFNTDSVKEQTSGSDNGNNEVLKYQESDSSSSDKIGSNSNNVEKSGNDKESLFNTDSVKEQTSGSDNGNNEVLKYQESDSSSSDKIGSNSNNVEKSGNDKESLFNTDSVKDQTSGSDNGNNEVLKYQESDSSSSANQSIKSANENSSPSCISDMITNYYHRYLKGMIVKYELKTKLPIVEENSIVIITPKGYKEKITMDRYHGYKYLDNIIYCLLCTKLIKKDINHISSEEHVRNILEPVNDDFTRGVIRDCTWSHCLICNEMVITGSDHASYNLIHSKYFNDHNIAKLLMPLKLNRIFCYVCDKYFDPENVIAHENRSTHKRKLKTLKSINKNGGSNKNVNIDDLCCKVCKIYVGNEKMAIHEQGKSHQSKYDLINKVLEHLTTEFTNLSLNQDILNEMDAIISKAEADKLNIMDSDQAEAETLPPQIKTHFTNQEKLFEYKKQTSILTETEVKCLICDVDVPSASGSLIPHVEGVRHKTAVDSLLQEHKIVQLAIINLYYCELCKLNIDDFIYHINENTSHMIEVILHNEIDENELKEYVYNDSLKDDPLAVAYKSVHEKLLQQNEIERFNSISYYCYKCCITLLLTDEIAHMFGQKHKCFK